MGSDFAEDDVADDQEDTRLSSEYAIVQDKIDKIGAFRFTIRGWTVTLITGAILAVASTKILSPYVLLFLLVMLGIFAAFERKQNRNQEILEDRAIEIEVVFRRKYYKGSADDEIRVPRIAHHLREMRTIGVGRLAQFISDPDRWFYWVLMIVVLTATALLVYTRPGDETGKSATINVVNTTNANSENNKGVLNDSPKKEKHRSNETSKAPKTAPN